jgi:quercetin 2,3-dioxygenase
MGQTLWLDFPQGGEGCSTLEVSADRAMRLLLIAGEPIQEPVVAYGPFVMNTREEIVQAFEDYRDGLFGGPTPAGLELATG